MGKISVADSATAAGPVSSAAGRIAGWRARWRRGLSELFAEPVGAGLTWRGLALGVLGVAAGTGVSLLRQPGFGPFDTVWAEDGSFFLETAISHGFVDSVTTSYAGYYHLVPRVLAEAAAALPPQDAAIGLSVAAAVTTSLMALLVYVASAGHLTSRVSRLLVAAVTLVVPLGMQDVPNSIANLQWPGLYTLFWLLLWTPRGLPGRVGAVFTTLCIAGSNILTPALFPLALVRVLRRRHDGRRERFAAVLLGSLLAGLTVQVLGLATGESSRSLAPDPVKAVSGYLVRAIPPGLLGERFYPADVNLTWLALAAIAWLLVLAAILVALARWSSPAWALAITAAICGMAVYALPVLSSGIATARYAVPTAMMLVVVLTALLQPRMSRSLDDPSDGSASSPAHARGVGRFAPRGRGPHIALTVLLVAVWLVNLRVDNPRAHGPGWGEELDRARTVCATGSPTAEVHIAPQPAGEVSWWMQLPCTYITR